MLPGAIWAVLLLVAECNTASAAHKAATSSDRLAADVKILVQMKIVENGDYWLATAVQGKQCAGERVGSLLMQTAKAPGPAANFEQALDLLAKKHIIWNDYWAKNAIAGRQCDGQFVADLIHAAAARLAAAGVLGKYGVPDGVLLTPPPSAFSLAGDAAGPNTFNYVIGTQTFSPAYQFTKQTRLVETAEAIRAMGSTAIKFELSPRYARPNGNVPHPMASVHSLTELARDEPSHRRVLDMPFTHFVLWRTPSTGDTGKTAFPKPTRRKNTVRCMT